MLIYAIEISKTPSSGTVSFNTPKFDAGLLKHIYLKSASVDTTFDVKITDSRGNNIIDTSVSGESPVGIFNKFYDMPLKEIHTVYIFNSSADELFTGKISIMEES